MARPRSAVLVGVIVALAVAQILVEDVIVFLGATGTGGSGALNSPVLLVGVPFVLFLLLAGVVWAWALAGDDPRW